MYVCYKCGALADYSLFTYVTIVDHNYIHLHFVISEGIYFIYLLCDTNNNWLTFGHNAIIMVLILVIIV